MSNPTPVPMPPQVPLPGQSQGSVPVPSVPTPGYVPAAPNASAVPPVPQVPQAPVPDPGAGVVPPAPFTPVPAFAPGENGTPLAPAAPVPDYSAPAPTAYPEQQFGSEPVPASPLPQPVSQEPVPYAAVPPASNVPPADAWQQPAGVPQSVSQPSYAAANPPAKQLKTKRGLLKYILLGIVTFGIYDIWQMTEISDTINIIASRRDGKRTMNYCLMFFLIGGLTLGIGWLVWYHKLSGRIGEEQQARGLAVTVTAGTFWLWDVLGIFIIVGPWIYMYKLLHAMNDLCADYNVRG